MVVADLRVDGHKLGPARAAPDGIQRLFGHVRPRSLLAAAEDDGVRIGRRGSEDPLQKKPLLSFILFTWLMAFAPNISRLQ
jgi:hypothetical protein